MAGALDINNLDDLLESRDLHRLRYGWARGDLAAVRADARAGTKGRTAGIITHEEAQAIKAEKQRVARELELIRRRDRQISDAMRTGRPRESFRVSVRNQSSRGGVRPSLIVLHTTEGRNLPGLADLKGLAGWFDNPAARASSHVGVDAEGNSAQFVPDARKAWTQAYYNPQALAIEQIGFARQNAFAHLQLLKTAQYIAYWHETFGIPIVQSTTRGVCEHEQLGAAGGGHHDCGPHYPFAQVLTLARKIANV